MFCTVEAVCLSRNQRVSKSQRYIYGINAIGDRVSFEIIKAASLDQAESE